MGKIDEKSLKLDVYEYFKYYNGKKCIRGAGVITDKQYIFYTQVLEDDYRTHNDIEIDIENTIHPDNQKYGWDAYYENHAYVASLGKELIISMPENGELSAAQASFIIDILEQVDKYETNKENYQSKIEIQYFDTTNSIVNTINDIKSLKKTIQNRITEKITIEEEVIIGTTLSKEKIKTNLLTNLDFKKCTNLKEVVDNINKCSIYYQDSYYRDIFLEIFPNYIEIKEIIKIFSGLDIEQEKVENITFENIKEVIYTSIKNIFKHKNTYHELNSLLIRLDDKFNQLSNEEQQKIFPNFKLIKELFKNLCPIKDEETKYINSLLVNVSNYEDFSKIVCNLSYNKKSQELIQTQTSLNNVSKSLEDIKIKKNIVASRELLDTMIDRKQELAISVNSCDLKLDENRILIDDEVKYQDNKTKIIQDKSSTFFKKVIDRRKIKNYTTELDSSKLKSQTLENERKKLLEEQEKLKQEITDIKRKFKDITNLDYFPIDKSFMESYYEKDYSEYETQMTKWRVKLRKEIELLKEELTRIAETGLIIQEDKNQENIKEEKSTISSRSHH